MVNMVQQKQLSVTIHKQTTNIFVHKAQETVQLDN